MKKLTVKETNEKIEILLNHIKLAGSHLTKAARIYAELIKNDPSIKLTFVGNGISNRTLIYLEKLGRNQTLPELYHTQFQNTKLQLSDQLRLVNEKIDYVFYKEDGSTDSVRIDLLNSTDPQIKRRIIKDGRILTKIEQRNNLLAAREYVTKIKAQPIPYIVKKNCLEIYPSDETTKFTKRQVGILYKSM